jgi:hypothetical protein
MPTHFITVTLNAKVIESMGARFGMTNEGIEIEIPATDFDYKFVADVLKQQVMLNESEINEVFDLIQDIGIKKFIASAIKQSR